MFVTEDGEAVFVIDGHVHLWDARPENRLNRYGETFVECFWNAHNGLTPEDQRWDWERFEYYGVDGAAKDLFEDGYCDLAVMLLDERKDGIDQAISNVKVALDAVNAIDELVTQLNRERIVPSAIVHASGSGGTQAGLLVGLQLTRAGIPGLPALSGALPRSRAQPDDLLDAAACALAARDIQAGRATRLPGPTPPRDARGLRMEIWF